MRKLCLSFWRVLQLALCTLTQEEEEEEEEDVVILHPRNNLS